jgi:hypothetical protein
MGSDWVGSFYAQHPSAEEINKYSEDLAQRLEVGGGKRKKNIVGKSNTMRKSESPKELAALVDALQQEVLFSQRKGEIVKAFGRLMCIVRGRCVNTLAKDFDGTDFVFEYVRCLLPSRFFQLVKELHMGTRRWTYVQPLYRELLANVYEDLNPDVPVISNGEMENQKCGSTSGVSPAALGRAAEVLEARRAKNEATARKARLMRYKLLKLEFDNKPENKDVVKSANPPKNNS